MFFQEDIKVVINVNENNLLLVNLYVRFHSCACVHHKHVYLT